MREYVEPGVRLIGSRTGWTRAEIINQPLFRFIADVNYFNGAK